MTLSEFLLARIAEDEAHASMAPKPGTSMWDGAKWVPCMWSPARVLAECDADRRIVEAHWDGTPDPDFPELLLADCPECRQTQPCRTLRMLALPYADHPDYDARWRP